MIQVLKTSQFAETLLEWADGFDAVSESGLPVVIGALGCTIGEWKEVEGDHTYCCASYVDSVDGKLVSIVYHSYPTGKAVKSDFDIAAYAIVDADEGMFKAVADDYAKMLMIELDDSTLSHMGTWIFHAGDNIVLTGQGYAPAGDGYEIVNRMRHSNYGYWTTYVRKGVATFQVHTADRMINVTRSAPNRKALERCVGMIATLMLTIDKGLNKPIPMEYIAALFGLISPPPTIEEVISDASRTANNGTGTAIARVESEGIAKTNATWQLAAPLSNGDGVHL